MARKQIKDHCKDEVGKVYPVVNFNNCSGKEDCIAVCPYNVFELHTITKEDKAQLNFKGKVKTFFFKNKAYVINPDQCYSCGLCVQAVPKEQ